MSKYVDHRFKFKPERSPMDQDFEKQYGRISFLFFQQQQSNLNRKQDEELRLKKSRNSTSKIDCKSVTQLPDIFSMLSNQQQELSSFSSESSTSTLPSNFQTLSQKTLQPIRPNQFSAQHIKQYRGWRK